MFKRRRIRVSQLFVQELELKDRYTSDSSSLAVSLGD